ncbi:MAG: PEP/pyruvate-binding domain-containing protein [bacterium]|nr:PEP/pyruvate-binding domain-containing protein [bacterium]
MPGRVDPVQPACSSTALRRNVNSFKELCSASSSALDALDALANLHKGISEVAVRRQEQGLSFSLLKKLGLQLSVQAHKCIRLLTVISGEDDAVLRSALNGQLQNLATILGDGPPSENEPLFQRLRSGRQDTACASVQQKAFPEIRFKRDTCSPAFIINKAAGRRFFHAARLYARINHSLQQLDYSNSASLALLSADIQRLIMTAPLPDEVQTGLVQELQELFSPQEKGAIALFPQVHSEDGSRSSFAGLIPALRQIAWNVAGAAEQAYKEILAALYSPHCLVYMEARGLRHESTGISVLCVPEDAILSRALTQPPQPLLAEPSAPLLQGCTGSPVVKALSALCRLTGANLAPLASDCMLPPLRGTAEACGSTSMYTSMLDLILACRCRALQALLCQSSHGGILQLTPALRFFLYSIDELLSARLPTQGNDEQILAAEPLTAPLLQALWRGMRQQVEVEPGRMAALDVSVLKNSVLLNGKCCTLQVVCPDFFFNLTAEQDRHGQNFRLVVLLEDSRVGSAQRLSQLADLLVGHGLRVQAAGQSLRALVARTSFQPFEHDLRLLGALAIQTLTEQTEPSLHGH